ncbi:MAG TPA: hypothetical protein VEQ59_14570, partial [Polyangiaceae bacterium]|nr:hypothetical protein [Polyangiaceae bacterium]
MTKRAFGSQLAVTAAAVVLGVAAEALVVALRADDVGSALAWAGWSLGLWAVPAALFAMLAASLLAAVCGEEALSWALVDAWNRAPQRDGLLVGLAAASLLGGWIFVSARACAGFHNLELAAALVSL